jgi:hypothetical protein
MERNASYERIFDLICQDQRPFTLKDSKINSALRTQLKLDLYVSQKKSSKVVNPVYQLQDNLTPIVE